VGQNVSVCILSDNRLFRESLRRILTKRGDFEIAFSRGVPEIGSEEPADCAADVVVLDSVEFLIRNGSLWKSRKESRDRVKILLVAMDEDERLFLRAVRAGALGFIPKDASALDVIAAVRCVARGEAVCPPRFCKFLFDFTAAQAIELPNSCVKLQLGLTRREQQLVPMIGGGLTNKEIANQLNLSEQTIKNHVHHILHKIGVENRLAILTAIHTHEISDRLASVSNGGTF